MPENDVSLLHEPPPPPLITRLWFAFVAALRVLVDARFAARVWSVREGMPPAPALPAPKGAAAERDGASDALALLALLQREGRLIDFVEQDITGFDDADVGAAARVVHEGCRKALRSAATIEAVRAEDEDSPVAVEEGYDPSEVKLTGNVSGKPPYRGLLRHRGWRVAELSLPRPVEGHDVRVVAPAEVELS